MEGDLDRAEFDADTRTVFCHATCFGTALMRRVEARLATLRPGAFVLMLGKELRAADFQLLESSRRPASWGVADGPRTSCTRSRLGWLARSGW